LGVSKDKERVGRGQDSQPREGVGNRGGVTRQKGCFSVTFSYHQPKGRSLEGIGEQRGDTDKVESSKKFINPLIDQEPCGNPVVGKGKTRGNQGTL